MIERTATELLQSLSQGEITSESLVNSCLAAIDQRDSTIQALLAVDADKAHAQAMIIDQRRQQGEPLGPLAGIPVVLKDNMCVQGWTTSCGSRMLNNYQPPYDAHVVTKLHKADAILLGRANMDEYAMGSSTENSGFQITRNPWDTERIPGGSSGGSAAAVASCQTPLALGSDTGGSIRQPAGFCGVVGMKPTYGRVSRFGLVAYASSLDQIGPLTHDVTDAALLLETIAGHDKRDSTSVDQPVPSYSQTVDQPLDSLTIGIPKEYFGEGLDSEIHAAVQEAIKVYQGQGATIKDVSLPNTPHAIATYYLVATAEASSNLARYEGVHYGHRAEKFKDLLDMYQRSRGEGFGSEVKRRIMLGTYALSSGYIDAYYLKALKVRRLIKDDFDRAFGECDILLCPTSPTSAFKIGERASDPLAMYLSDVYTISANLAGLPAISIPCGFTSDTLPIGLQLLAAPFQEDTLLRAARTFERETDWHQRRPTL